LTSEQPPLEEFRDPDTEPGVKEWEEVVFSDVISINDYPSAKKGKEYRSVGMSDIARNQRKIEDWEYKEYSYSRPRFKNGQTLMARITPCLENGKTAFVDILGENEVAVGSTEFIVLSATDRTLPKFVYYTARRPEIRQFAIKRMTGTSGRQRVPLDIFDNKKIGLPPVEEQKKIVSVLDAIDSKIETNNRIHEILEEIAEALFESWFVDFEPYNEFRKSEIGNVPVDFSVNPLETVLSFQRGYSYSGDDLIDDESDLEPSEGYPMINLGTINPSGGYNSDGIKYSKDLPKDKYRVEAGDLVISHTDMTQDLEILGSPVLVPDLTKKEMLFSHHLYKVTESDLPAEYLYYYFLSPYFKPKAENFASGTTVLSFSSKIASDVHIPIPPQPELDQYVEKVRPIFETKEEIRKENNRLAGLRDTLLPKLMSGEVRVNDIELYELQVDSEV
jgi:type I restriction enzyme S subunit